MPTKSTKYRKLIRLHIVTRRHMATRHQLHFCNHIDTRRHITTRRLISKRRHLAPRHHITSLHHVDTHHHRATCRTPSQAFFSSFQYPHFLQPNLKVASIKVIGLYARITSFNLFLWIGSNEKLEILIKNYKVSLEGLALPVEIKACTEDTLWGNRVVVQPLKEFPYTTK